MYEDGEDLRSTECLMTLILTFTGFSDLNQYVTQVQQRRPKLPMVTLTWHVCKYKVHKLHQRYILKEVHTCQARVTIGSSGLVVLVLRILSANYLPWVLILQECSGPHSISDL